MSSLQRAIPKAGQVQVAVGLLICIGGAASLVEQASQILR